MLVQMRIQTEQQLKLMRLEFADVHGGLTVELSGARAVV